jgi:dTMP kinase
MEYRGGLIVFEGPDGVGKTAIAGSLRSYLENRRVRCELFSFPGKEGGTLGRLVYGLHHAAGSRARASKPDATALQLAHVAAHIDVIERRILPALRNRSCVILDRFWWSTMVYGTLAGADPWSIKAMLRLEQHHWRGAPKPFVILVRRVQGARLRIPNVGHIKAKYESLFVEETKRRRRSFAIVDNSASIDEAAAISAQLAEHVWRPLVRTRGQLSESQIVRGRLPLLRAPRIVIRP